jgi:UDP-glucose 4-epimerase
MKYLVTGGAGFIGSHLCDALLAGGHQVMVLDNLSTGIAEHVDARAVLVVGDVTRLDTVLPLVMEADGVFHLAAVASVEKSRNDWCATTHTNLCGMVTVLDAIKRQDQALPLVYASSAAVYGDTTIFPIVEGSPPLPRTAYGVDKYAGELHAGIGCSLHGIPSTGLRLFNVYGPRQNPASAYSGVISIFASRLLRHQPVTIYGDGRQSRDFIYVDDVVNLMKAAMLVHHATHSASAPVYNACTGQETTILRLALLLTELTQSAGEIHYAPAREGDIIRSCGSPERSLEALGVATSTDIRDGLARTLEWMKQYSTVTFS